MRSYPALLRVLMVFKVANKRMRTYLSLVICTVLCTHNGSNRGPYIATCIVSKENIVLQRDYLISFEFSVGIVQYLGPVFRTPVSANRG